MQGVVFGFCVITDGGVSYLACPWCHAHLCHAYQSFHLGQGYVETDTGSSSSETGLGDDEVFSCLRAIAGSPYAQVNIHEHMWVSCSIILSELEEARVAGRRFGTSIHDFKRLCEELSTCVPAGLVVVHVDKERAIIFRSGHEPAPVDAFSAVDYLRRWAAGGLALFGDRKIAFLESHSYPGSIRTSIRRLIRLTVQSWEN